jgi:hypothetical protein
VEEKMVHLSWERLGSNIVGYRVYRKIDFNGRFMPVSNMFYTPDKLVKFTDTTAKHLKAQNIEYYAVSISDGFLESNPSDTITYHKPGEIVKRSPKQGDFVLDSLNYIKLIWTSQDSDTEVKGYNVYKISNDKTVKLNEKLIPYHVNYYLDKTNAGKSDCDYEIETISITNTASLIRTPVKVPSQHIPQHLILAVSKTDKGISIQAVPLTDKEIKEIILLKKTAITGSPKQIAKLKPNDIIFTDVNVKSGEIYSYSAIAVYKDKYQEVVNAGVAIRY